MIQDPTNPENMVPCNANSYPKRYYAHNNLSEQVARYVKEYVHHCREERYVDKMERYEADVKAREKKMEAKGRELPGRNNLP